MKTTLKAFTKTQLVKNCAGKKVKQKNKVVEHHSNCMDSERLYIWLNIINVDHMKNMNYKDYS